ncbi:hypothetical protein [Candidatus Viadribacter manganicus]|uniref:Uncharacterized protein n=1 Tax=Candidatus Viadribacter manganicus TaxID=1759059 RepID=A0A1B1AK26_9PROT|nr:hypothetical protein [Candidatus Viadribacter manganicus]ANP46903.1 hypothetical protein ATE48_13745 [Candidatus Viadribacter manganicus]
MHLRFSIAALLLAPLLMAQTPPPQTITDAGSPVLAPVAAAFNAEPQTMTGASVVLAQQANVIGAVRVDAPVAGAIPVGNASIALSVAPGTELFPVLLQQRRNVRLFCTVSTETNVYSPIRPPLITRTCLADTNGDRVFDYLAYMQVNITPTRSVSGAWETPPVPHVSGGAITLATAQIASPVPYTPLQQHRIAPVSLELSARIVGETAVLDLRSREGAANASVSDQREAVQAANMPRIVNFNGAQVELQSLNAGTLSYRIVSAIPTDQPLTFQPGRR